MKTMGRRVLFVLALISIAFGTTAYAADKGSGYTIIKGGVYSPSGNYNLNNFNGSSTTIMNTATGFNGEIAVGGYLIPQFLALELGVGYFESDSSPASGPGKTELQAVPLLLTAKGFVPIGPVEVYGELGAGVYFTQFKVSGNTGSFNSESKVAYGAHAGAGFNIDLSRTFFIGLEGRYLMVKPEYNGQSVELNGYTATINLGFRN